MIIVPVYNLIEIEQMIQRCLYSIRNTTSIPLCIIDDASPIPFKFDPAGDEVLIRNLTNEGYTKTINTGIKHALDKKYDVVIIANDDLYFTDGQWDWVNDCKENTIVSPKTTDEGEGNHFGAIWAAHKTVFEKIGFLNEKLAHFFSDTEYYHRAKWKGVNIIKRNDVVIEHHGSATYSLTNNKSIYYDNDQKVYRNLV